MPAAPITSPRNFLVKTLREAGKILLRGYRQPHRIRYKGGNATGRSPVTKTDSEIDAFIRAAIRRRFPEDAYLSEELSPETATRGRNAWVVDPIDGTANFMNGMPFFAISAARLDERGRVALGAVYDALHGEMFVAERGRGATLNGRDLRHYPAGIKRPHTVRYGGWNEEKDDRAMVRKIRSRLGAKDRFKVYRFGSSALTLTYVAAGRLDVAVLFGKLSPWDIAAAYLIAEETGIRIARPDGSASSIFSPKLIAAPRPLLRLLR